MLAQLTPGERTDIADNVEIAPGAPAQGQPQGFRVPTFEKAMLRALFSVVDTVHNTLTAA